MGRQPSVAGGRPHVVRVRLSDSELAALDAVQGSRSDALRSLIPQRTRWQPPSEPLCPESPLKPSADLSDAHIHQWARSGEYLDACPCGTERPHQAGTR